MVKTFNKLDGEQNVATYDMVPVAGTASNDAEPSAERGLLKWWASHTPLSPPRSPACQPAQVVVSKDSPSPSPRAAGCTRRASLQPAPPVNLRYRRAGFCGPRKRPRFI